MKATDEKGERIPYVITRAEPEAYHGRRYLHLQANVPRKLVDGKFVHAVFSVAVE